MKYLLLQQTASQSTGRPSVNQHFSSHRNSFIFILSLLNMNSTDKLLFYYCKTAQIHHKKCGTFALPKPSISTNNCRTYQLKNSFIAVKSACLLLPHRRSRTFRYALGRLRHEQNSTLVAEQTAIFSVCSFLRVNM